MIPLTARRGWSAGNLSQPLGRISCFLAYKGYKGGHDLHEGKLLLGIKKAKEGMPLGPLCNEIYLSQPAAQIIIAEV